MVVASVDEDKIIVAGPIHAGTLAMFGMLGDSSEGFTCIYANADQAKAIQLRTGDPITITGKLTGWETDLPPIAVPLAMLVQRPAST
jgi:hypothetical protein